jgi:hypothetical protein
MLTPEVMFSLRAGFTQRLDLVAQVRPTATPTPSATAFSTHTRTPTPTATATSPATATSTARPPDPPTPTATPELFVVKGRVWHDRNRNGEIDAGEKGLANVRVLLLTEESTSGGGERSRSIYVQTATDALGDYVIAGIEVSAYLVVEQDPAGHASTTPNEVIIRATTAGELIIVNFGDHPYWRSFIPQPSP